MRQNVASCSLPPLSLLSLPLAICQSTHTLLGHLTPARAHHVPITRKFSGKTCLRHTHNLPGNIKVCFCWYTRYLFWKKVFSKAVECRNLETRIVKMYLKLSMKTGTRVWILWENSWGSIYIQTPFSFILNNPLSLPVWVGDGCLSLDFSSFGASLQSSRRPPPSSLLPVLLPQGWCLPPQQRSARAL